MLTKKGYEWILHINKGRFNLGNGDFRPATLLYNYTNGRKEERTPGTALLVCLSGLNSPQTKGCCLLHCFTSWSGNSNMNKEWNFLFPKRLWSDTLWPMDILHWITMDLLLSPSHVKRTIIPWLTDPKNPSEHLCSPALGPRVAFKSTFWKNLGNLIFFMSLKVKKT